MTTRGAGHAALLGGALVLLVLTLLTRYNYVRLPLALLAVPLAFRGRDGRE